MLGLGGSDGEVSAAGLEVVLAPHTLRDYALLADGERGALIGPRGDISWMCLPAWDSAAVFSSLIGGGGRYAVTPTGRFVWGGYYEDATLIWHSRWTTTSGAIECHEALGFPGERHRAILLRQVHAFDADAHVRVLLDVQPEFGRQPMSDLHRDDDGRWTARSGSLRMRWTGGGDARVVNDGKTGVLFLDLVVPVGAVHDLVLELSDQELPEPPDPGRLWDATRASWHRSAPPHPHMHGERDARHAQAILRGLTSSHGGMVAAATASLPERARVGRNYDYRYAWIRDQCFTGVAAHAAEDFALLDNAVRFVSARLLEDGPQLRPAYTVRGGPVPDQHHLDLEGYPGGYDILGNHVNKQFQLDAFGEALQMLSAAARADRLDPDGWRALETAAGAIEERWTEPDAGIWELEPRQWTHSKLACVAGLRAAGAVAGATGSAARWLALADRILGETAATSLHPSGRWQRAPDDDRVDAALLLPPIDGALPPDDPRNAATYAAVRGELAEGGYVYRFRHDQRPLYEAEGAFLLCGFVAALSAHRQGNEVEAMHYFERNRSACGPPGILSEEFDIVQRQLRGNLPQAFVHALLIRAAATLGDHH